MRRIKPSEISQAQRFVGGPELVDESVIERYREMGDQLDHVRAARHYGAMLEEANAELPLPAEAVDVYEQHCDAIQGEEPIPPASAMRDEIDAAFDRVLGEGRR